MNERYAFGHKIYELLDKKINEKLSINSEELKDYAQLYPYTIC
jgi:hypothetical protein